MHKWGLRIIRLAALALIAFPEPITTAIGVGILAGTGFLLRKSDNKMLKRFERVLRDHLNQMRHLEYAMSVKHQQQDMVEHHALDMGALSKQYKFDNGFKPRTSEKVAYQPLCTPLLEQHYRAESRPQTSSQSPFIQYSVHRNKALLSDKVVHHRLDILQLSRRYQIGEYSQPVNQQKVIRHSLRTPPPSRGDEVGSEFGFPAVHSMRAGVSQPPQKVEHHVINMARLSAQYGKEGRPSPDIHYLSRPVPPIAQESTQHHMVNMAMLLSRYNMEYRLRPISVR